ncbi:MAG: SpoIIIAH-like family protein [Clostridia bacterium]|nr:SpoIIIAH-like family protein [Clostridia bacterium]
MKQGKHTKTVKEKREKSGKNKMLVVRKRQVAALSLILLIGIAGYLNLSLSESEADPGVAVMYQEASKRLGEAKMVNSSGDNAGEQQTEQSAQNEAEAGVTNNDKAPSAEYFANARTEREKKRGEATEMLKELMNAPETDKETRKGAEEQIVRLAQYTEQETQAENTIRAKGYGDCVVYMGENVTTVAVATENLNEIDAAVITDVVSQGGNVRADQVKIVEIKP